MPPALEPLSTTPCSHAERSAASMPCTRQIASMFAVLPPPTNTTSWSSTHASRSAGGHGKKSSRRTSAFPSKRSYVRSACAGSSAPAVPTYSRRGRSRPVRPTRKSASPSQKSPPPIATIWRSGTPGSKAARLWKDAPVTARERYVYDFDEEAPGGRELLGGKGIGLAEMTALGVPVPAGFTVTTDACRAYMRGGREVPEGLDDEVERHIGALEERSGRRFGDPNDPLLVSVRSGAAVSMPGM